MLGILCGLLLFSAVSSAEDSFEIIRQGSKGERVVRIQERLFDLGFYAYKPTGSYQTVTRSAVISYQLAAGLQSDGTIGQETYNALFAHSAIRAPFHAAIPLTYAAPSGIPSRGLSKQWSMVQQQLIEGTSYTITNAYTGESCSVVYTGGTNHAHFTLPAQVMQSRNTARMLAAWLGDTNSFYKCAVLLSIDEQSIAASIQWNGNDTICLYTAGASSDVFGMPDPDHEAMLARITLG